jgi:hypothetical protein
MENLTALPAKRPLPVQPPVPGATLVSREETQPERFIAVGLVLWLVLTLVLMGLGIW